MGEVYKWVDDYGGRICNQLRRLGSSLDWGRQVFTMDEPRSVRGVRGQGGAAKGVPRGRRRSRLIKHQPRERAQATDGAPEPCQ